MGNKNLEASISMIADRLKKGYGSKQDTKILEKLRVLREEFEEKEKKEKITDQCNVMMVVALKKEDRGSYEEMTFKLNDMKYHDEEGFYEDKVRIMKELRGERIVIYKGEDKHSVISKEFYYRAVNTLKSFYGVSDDNIKIKFMLAEEKDYPVIVYDEGRNFGIMIAPRIDDGRI